MYVRRDNWFWFSWGIDSKVKKDLLGEKILIGRIVYVCRIYYFTFLLFIVFFNYKCRDGYL